MRKIIRWVGIILGGLVLLAVLAAGGLILSSEARFNRTYVIRAEAVPIPTDAASLAAGRHWAEMHCQSCHAADLGGGPLFDDPALGYVDAPNLTAGPGGVGARYTDADWVRAVRHGIRGDGTSVFIMPSNDFYYLSDADLGSLIAYLKTVAPVARTVRPRTLTPLAKLIYALGGFSNLLYAETIAHDVRPPAPPAGITADYGRYLVNAHGCPSCHGPQLTGQQPSEPGAPFAPNLTPGGELRGWQEADFFRLMRGGTTPTGRVISDYMPWKAYGRLRDEELRALWQYLQGVPAAVG